jgi:hypothetical protein
VIGAHLGWELIEDCINSSGACVDSCSVLHGNSVLEEMCP